MRTHSFLSNKCEVKKSQLAGLGVYAKKVIKKGELIAVWGGIIYTLKEVMRISKRTKLFCESPVSVYEGFYIGPLSESSAHLDDAERFNHCCEPNAGIKGQIIVVARKDIQPREEICFDYDTTEIDAVPFKCKCGSTNCRKIVDGNGWKNNQFLEKNKEYLSWYIQEKIRNERK